MRFLIIGQVCLGLLMILAVGGRAVAQEIRVLDGAGLIRAVQPSSEPLSVEISVSAPAGMSLAGAVLVQTSGLAEDRIAEGREGRYTFPSVPPGTWRIALREPKEKVSAVKIAN